MMEVEKVNPSQEAVGAFPQPPGGLDEAVQQKSSCVTLKEFQKQGIKQLKVISQKGLEELINLVVEGELKRRLDKEREGRLALEEEANRLKRELEALRGKGVAGSTGLRNDWQERLREIVSNALKQVREDHVGEPLSVEFIRRLEEVLPGALEKGLVTHSPGVAPKQSAPGGHRQGTSHARTGGGLFDGILKDNLKLRGANQGASGA
jgi:hypothetical protein